MPFAGKFPETALFVYGVQGAMQAIWFYQQIKKLYSPMASKNIEEVKRSAILGLWK